MLLYLLGSDPIVSLTLVSKPFVSLLVTHSPFGLYQDRDPLILRIQDYVERDLVPIPILHFRFDDDVIVVPAV